MKENRGEAEAKEKKLLLEGILETSSSWPFKRNEVGWGGYSVLEVCIPW